MVNFEIYDVIKCKTSNISRSKGNQTMNCFRLIEYNMKNHKQNMMEEQAADSFLKNWAYLWINSTTFYTVCFYGMSKLRNTKIL